MYQRTLRLSLGAFVLGSLILPLMASAVVSNFTFRINDRAPQFPVARVKITLDTAASPAGSTLEIAGTTLNFNGLLQPLPSGDLVLFDWDGVSNRVTIEISPLSNLQTLGNFCVADPGATFPDDWALTFDGPAIDGYRTSTYAAPSGVQCGCPSRRVNNVPAVWLVPPPGTDNGRHALDVILVLDESGSMGSIVSGTDTKMDLLQWAVGQFVDAWKVEATGVSDDRLGAVFFTTGVDAPMLPFFIERGADGSAWDDVKDTVNLRTPQNLTALGPGIQEGIDRWTADPQNDANLVVLTNGLQNVSPQVIADVVDPSLLALDGVPLSSYCGITMQTIGIGAPATVQADLLDEIALETGGKSNVTVADQIDLAWRDTLVEALKGDTLELLAEQLGTLQAHQSSNQLTVELNRSASQGIALLAWRGQRSALDLAIHPPGGGGPITPILEANDPFYRIHTFDLPKSGSPGLWTVEVERAEGDGAVDYHLSVMAVEDTFSYRVNLDRPGYRAGEPIVIRAEVSENGVAATRLGKAIVAEVKSPPNPLGTLLHKIQVDDSILATNPDGFHGDQFPTASSRKLFYLIEERDLLKQIEPGRPKRYILYDDGDPDHGDLKANDGVYSAKIVDTKIPGEYNFKVSINAETRKSGTVRRVEFLETQVQVGQADPKQTLVDVTPLRKRGEWLVTIVPADRFGHFFGPDYEDRIDVVLKGGGVAHLPAKDVRADGTYTVHLTHVPPGGESRIVVKIEGKTIAGGRVNTLDRPNQKRSAFGGLGVTSPRDDLDAFFDASRSFQLGVEHRFTNRFGLEATYGHDRFSAGFPDLASTKLHRLTLDAKVYPRIGTFQIALFGGIGAYDIEGDSTRGGFNLGSAVEYRLDTRWSLEAAHTFHQINSGSDLRYSTTHIQARKRFNN